MINFNLTLVGNYNGDGVDVESQYAYISKCTNYINLFASFPKYAYGNDIVTGFLLLLNFNIYSYDICIFYDVIDVPPTLFLSSHSYAIFFYENSIIN